MSLHVSSVVVVGMAVTVVISGIGVVVVVTGVVGGDKVVSGIVGHSVTGNAGVKKTSSHK